MAYQPWPRHLASGLCPSMLRFFARRGSEYGFCPRMLRFLRSNRKSQNHNQLIISHAILEQNAGFALIFRLSYCPSMLRSLQNHGWSHLKVWRLNQEELRYEVQHNDTAIYQNTGQFPRTYIFPGNSKTDSAISFCTKDRVGLRMKQIAIGGKRKIPELCSRIEKAIEKHEPIVGMTHGITRGYDCFDTHHTALEFNGSRRITKKGCLPAAFSIMYQSFVILKGSTDLRLLLRYGDDWFSEECR